MKALVLEKKLQLSLRDIELPKEVHPNDVKIKMHTVGICGSDVHYYTHGKIGPFVVKEPMVLGHEGSGTVIEVGSNVSSLKVGDRVCIEPGVPDVYSKEYMRGLYNLDPKLTFWATPPDHGCLTPEVVFPSNFVFKLPENVSYAEGAMIEPLAVGLQAAEKAKIIPGETALVMGCGPIGLVIALTALAGGCSKVFIADIVSEKLKMCSNFENLIPIDLNKDDPAGVIKKNTNDWGANIIFEASGATKAYATIFDSICPAGRVVIVGNPMNPIPMDFATLLTKEIEIKTVFRYAHQYERAINLLSSNKIDVKPMITDTVAFDDSIMAFERAAKNLPEDVKIQIQL
ncbi:MAG: NAD(P)-dependent alcohol dehydrogenase [alpha proteobacterium HIMB59]|nr:MAG: NAD(P)-dependent alcohol dehydrogenase [alpha proteobacterium HIMB59]|tara:strand:+ start:14002 stop:15033 length:1032 start_codon:yes stop_codon:yes gene_type:complete